MRPSVCVRLGGAAVLVMGVLCLYFGGGAAIVMGGIVAARSVWGRETRMRALSFVDFGAAPAAPGGIDQIEPLVPQRGESTASA